ncbi:MAG: nucleotide exchange factor GrpE [bacterium]|nr:nucleotide exchange factor GrpE [bacterium]
MSTKKQIQAQLARALADYDNLRKRSETEREIWIKFSSERILTKLLPILDMLESAQNHLKDSGLAIGLAELRKILQEEGLEEIKPNPKDTFDHEVCEVVESIEGTKDNKGQIAETILSGWRFTDGPVIRFAKVKVFGDKI